jgi:hypothetical protein
MKAIITQIESVVTPSGNSGYVVVPKAKDFFTLGTTLFFQSSQSMTIFLLIPIKSSYGVSLIFPTLQHFKGIFVNKTTFYKVFVFLCI